jgi:hypothetical protein
MLPFGRRLPLRKRILNQDGQELTHRATVVRSHRPNGLNDLGSDAKTKQRLGHQALRSLSESSLSSRPMSRIIFRYQGIVSYSGSISDCLNSFQSGRAKHGNRDHQRARKPLRLCDNSHIGPEFFSPGVDY